MEIEPLFYSIIPRYPELIGQVAVITGAAQGIGQGIAIHLAREGLRVVAADIKQEALAATTSVLRKLGATVLDFHGDLSQPEIIKQLFCQTVDTFNTVHLLVNNAADLHRKRLLTEHEALLELQLATNIRGPYLCSLQAAEIMRKAGAGNILNISSVGGLRAHQRGLPYDVTKGAIDAMTRAMAIDLAEFNIRVNAIGPGAIRKNKMAPAGNPEIQNVIGRIPLQRFGTVSDVSSLVAFLASSEASYITGQVIYVDGGITAQLSPPGQEL